MKSCLWLAVFTVVLQESANSLDVKKWANNNDSDNIPRPLCIVLYMEHEFFEIFVIILCLSFFISVPMLFFCQKDSDYCYCICFSWSCKIFYSHSMSSENVLKYCLLPKSLPFEKQIQKLLFCYKTVNICLTQELARLLEKINLISPPMLYKLLMWTFFTGLFHCDWNFISMPWRELTPKQIELHSSLSIMRSFLNLKSVISARAKRSTSSNSGKLNVKRKEVRSTGMNIKNKKEENKIIVKEVEERSWSQQN